MRLLLLITLFTFNVMAKTVPTSTIPDDKYSFNTPLVTTNIVLPADQVTWVECFEDAKGDLGEDDATKFCNSQLKYNRE